MGKRDTIILSALYLLGIAWMFIYIHYKVNILLCPTKWALGIPCPGCGMTRALSLLLKGDMVAAVTMNPNILIALVGIVLAPFLLFLQWFTNRDYMGSINSLLNRKQFLIPFCTFEIMIWAYNIMRHI